MATFELSTTCECLDEYDNETPECFGCYSDNLSQIKYLINELIEHNEATEFNVVGKNLGWQNLTAYGCVVADVDEILSGLVLERSDFRLVFEVDKENGIIDVTRYSHDEPTGARFVFEYVTTCDDDECDGECNHNFCLARRVSNNEEAI